MKKTNQAALISATSLSACATAPEQVTAAYVPTSAYAGQSCRELNAEARRISSALAAATGRQQQAASNDAAMTAAALILFWPAAFFMNGDRNAPELARLKGEAEAINAAAKAKGCAA